MEAPNLLSKPDGVGRTQSTLQSVTIKYNSSMANYSKSIINTEVDI